MLLEKIKKLCKAHPPKDDPPLVEIVGRGLLKLPDPGDPHSKRTFELGTDRNLNLTHVATPAESYVSSWPFFPQCSEG